MKDYLILNLIIIALFLFQPAFSQVKPEALDVGMRHVVVRASLLLAITVSIIS